MENIKQDNFSNKDSEDIDISVLFNILIRKKTLISIISGASLILGIINGSLRPKEYKGGFQIVVKEASVSSPTSGLANLDFLGLNLGNRRSQIATEVEILKSPSILKPVFDYVKSQKENDKIKFANWLNDHLDIEIQPNTTVLNISYKDNNKKLISEVLDRVSLIYENYSNKERLINLNYGIKYLDSQISLYRKKSLNSIKNAQEFEIKNDLTIAKETKVGSEPSFINTISIDKIRSIASNDIRKIEQYILQLKKLENKPNKFFYLVKSLDNENAFDNNNIRKMINKIDEIDLKITQNKAFFTSKDIEILRLKNEKKRLNKLLVKQTFSILDAKKSNSEAKKLSAQRPIEDLTKYRALLQLASRDEAILKNLESQKQNLLLEFARQVNPWKLITEPTVLENPVGPRKKRIAFLGLILGFISSIFIAFIIEKKEDKIYNEKEIKYLFKTNPTAKIRINDLKDLEFTLSLLSKNSSFFSEDKYISLLTIGDINNNEMKILKNTFIKVFKNKIFEIQNNLEASQNLSNQILLLRLGKGINKSEINNYLNKIRVIGNISPSWILLEE